MSTRDPKSIIEKFAEIARPEILREFPMRANCIESSLITVAVLRQYGIDAVPMAVKLGVWPKNRQQPGVSIGGICGRRHHRGLWKGSFAAHLIAVVPADGLLIDSSIDQVGLPGFAAPCPLVLRVNRRFCEIYKSIAYPPRSENTTVNYDLPDFELSYTQDRIPEGVKKALCVDDRIISVVKVICERLDGSKTKPQTGFKSSAEVTKNVPLDQETVLA